MPRAEHYRAYSQQTGAARTVAEPPLADSMWRPWQAEKLAENQVEKAVKSRVEKVVKSRAETFA